MYRVLIVEDDPQVAQINSDFLEQSGFEIAGVAANEQQAQALLRETQIQMILLDIYLPGSSGLHILKQIRAENRQVEVIIISAAKDSLQIREAFRLGCLDYIIKPFSYERLNDALKKYLQKMQLLQKNFLEQKEVDLLASHQPAEDAELGLQLYFSGRRLVRCTGNFGGGAYFEGIRKKISGFSLRTETAAANLCLWQQGPSG